MKTLALIIFLFISSGVLFSQNKIVHTQQEMENVLFTENKNELTQQEIEKSGVSELDAKKAVLNFFYDTKAEIRDSSRDLSLLEWEYISRVQQGIWDKSVRGLLKNYSTTPHGYYRFLADHYETLLMYKDVIMDIFHSAMHKDLSEKALMQMSDNASYRVKEVARRDF